jgi:hypothetical protein
MTNFTCRLYTSFIIFGLIAASHSSNAQLFKKPRNFLFSSGLNNGTLNFKDNVSSGFASEFSMNLITIRNLSLSFGTHAKVGIENNYGLGYPAMGAELGFFMLTGEGFPLANNYAGYGEMPLFLHLNFGDGSQAQCTNKLGFYFGAGFSGLTSGYNNGVISAQGYGFYGWTLDIGIRIGHQQLEFSKVISVSGAMTGIPNPVFYEFTYSFFGFLGNKR